MNISPKKLLSQLVSNKQISETEASKYEVDSLQKDTSIIDYLHNYTNIERIEIIKAQAEIEGINYVDLDKSPIDSQAVGLISESISRRYKIIPYSFDSANLIIYIATEDPFDRSIIDFLEKKTEVVRMKDVPETPNEYAMILQNGEGVQKQIYFDNPVVTQNNAILDELETFADAINNNTTPIITISNGTEALRVAQMVIDSF